MSHFSVLVVAKDEEELEKILLPYHEHECTGLDDYCQWVDDIHDEHLEEYNNDKIECVLLNGKVIGSKYSDNEIIQSMWKRNGIGHSSNDEFILADGYDLAEVPFNSLYSTFDKFMDEWCGYTEKNPETGKFERWTNPNAKWDWYQIGGRWSGKLLNVNGDMTNEELSQNIMWNEMYDKEKIRLTKQYEDFYFSYNNYLNNPSEEEENHYNDWCKRNKEVSNALTLNDYIKCSHAFDDLDWVMWSVSDAKEFLTKSQEEYSIPSGLTYAFIGSKGEWNQKGEMGWWGMDDKEKATDSYDGEWWNFVENLPIDSNVYVVDCHI